jgi:hypothetical protein
MEYELNSRNAKITKSLRLPILTPAICCDAMDEYETIVTLQLRMLPRSNGLYQPIGDNFKLPLRI